MSGDEFRQLAKEAIVKYTLMQIRIKKRIWFASVAWVCMIAVTEIIIWAQNGSQWWSIPLGLTFGILAVSFFIAFVNTFMRG